MRPGFQKPAVPVPSPTRAIHCLINRLWKSGIYLKLNCWAGHFMASLMCSLMFLSVYSSLSFLAEVFAYLIDQYAPPFLSHICQAGPSLLDFSFLKLTARCLPPPPRAQEPGPHLQGPARPRDRTPGEGWPRGWGRCLGRPTRGKFCTRRFHVAMRHPGRSTRVQGPLRRLSLPCPPHPSHGRLISSVSETNAAFSPGFIFY